jgi:hypothetical protein
MHSLHRQTEREKISLFKLFGIFSLVVIFLLATLRQMLKIDKKEGRRRRYRDLYSRHLSLQHKHHLLCVKTEI